MILASVQKSYTAIDFNVIDECVELLNAHFFCLGFDDHLLAILGGVHTIQFSTKNVKFYNVSTLLLSVFHKVACCF